MHSKTERDHRREWLFLSDGSSDGILCRMSPVGAGVEIQSMVPATMDRANGRCNVVRPGNYQGFCQVTVLGESAIAWGDDDEKEEG